MSELLPCPFCGSRDIGFIVKSKWEHITYYALSCFSCGMTTDGRADKKDAENLWAMRHSKYPLAPFSSTLDRLLGSKEAEADLGEIEHNGEKVIVKIKVVRGEG